MYRMYLGDVVLGERMQQFKQVEQDIIISQFADIIDSPDVVQELIKHWDAA